MLVCHERERRNTHAGERTQIFTHNHDKLPAVGSHAKC